MEPHKRTTKDASALRKTRVITTICEAGNYIFILPEWDSENARRVMMGSHVCTLCRGLLHIHQLIGCRLISVFNVAALFFLGAGGNSKKLETDGGSEGKTGAERAFSLRLPS